MYMSNYYNICIREYLDISSSTTIERKFGSGSLILILAIRVVQKRISPFNHMNNFKRHISPKCLSAIVSQKSAEKLAINSRELNARHYSRTLGATLAAWRMACTPLIIIIITQQSGNNHQQYLLDSNYRGREITIGMDGRMRTRVTIAICWRPNRILNDSTSANRCQFVAH